MHNKYNGVRTKQFTERSLDYGEKRVNVLEEFQEIEARIKKCVLEQGKTIDDNDIYRLIGEWRAIYETSYARKISEEVWKTTSIYTWLMLHYVLGEVSRQISWDD